MTKDSRSITVQALKGEEYSIDQGKNWQSSGVFRNLTPGKEYAIIARRAETEYRLAGEASDPLTVTTDTETSGGGTSTDWATSFAVMVSRFDPTPVPETDEEDPARLRAEEIRTIRNKYGKGNTLVIGSFRPSEAMETVKDKENPDEALAKIIAEAGYGVLIPDEAMGTEMAAVCAALEELDVSIPAANVYYDGTDGVHEAGENVFTPYTTATVTVQGNVHQIGILTLFNRNGKHEDEEGFLFIHPENEEGTLAKEAERYLKQMKEEDDCEFIIVCCYGDLEAPEGSPKGTLPPAEEMVRANKGIDVLILPEDPEKKFFNPAQLNWKGRKVTLLYEGDENSGYLFRFNENRNGDLIYSRIKRLSK